MDVTREDLREETKEIKDYIGERVGRVESELKILNGRVALHNRELGDHGARLTNIEHALFNNLVEVEPPIVPVVSDDQPIVTKRHVKLFAALSAGIAVVVEAAHRVWEFVAYLMSRP
jgi:hypothetical protein